MIEIKVNNDYAGQRFDKFLFRHLPDASHGFIYKMLRKKNIVLNRKKADGTELLVCDDVIQIYFADETYNKFRGSEKRMVHDNHYNDMNCPSIDIIYEDDNILLVNKPANMLSQKEKNSDYSINEMCLDYLVSKNDKSVMDLREYKPSICNRLDRNTTGIIIFAKTYNAARQINQALKDRTLHKYYAALVKGINLNSEVIDDYLHKDKKRNVVSINREYDADCYHIKTGYRVLDFGRRFSLLEVELFTGKSHQIRAHLASYGHPIVGDSKYGDASMNKELRTKYGITHQLLQSYRLIFPKFKDGLEYLSGKEFVLDIPKLFYTVMNEE